MLVHDFSKYFSRITGDQEYHQPVAHFAQIPYFFLACSSLLGLFGDQSLFSPGTRIRRPARRISRHSPFCVLPTAAIGNFLMSLRCWATSSLLTSATLAAVLAAWFAFVV